MKKKMVWVFFPLLVLLLLFHARAETEEEFWDYVNEYYPDDPFWDDYDESDFDDSWVNPDDYWGDTLTVPTADGFEELSYSDVFDNDGNFIYEYTGAGDKFENETIIADYFKGGGSSSGGDSTASVLISWYSHAMKALENAEREGLDMHTIWAIEDSIAICKTYLDSYCEENSYTLQVSKNQKYMQIVNEKGMPVANAGDPVILATGDFVIDDRDLLVQGRKSSFSLERHYSTGNAVPSAPMGFLGCGWTTNLETRIIRSYSMEFSSALSEWKSYREKLSEYEAEIAGYAESDSSCAPVLDSLRAIMAETDETISQIAFRAEENEGQRELNSFVEYGVPSSYSEGAGLDTIIYVQDEGGMVVFQKSGESFELTSPFRHCALELSLFEGGYCIFDPSSGEKRFYSKYGLPERFVFANGGTIEFSYDEQKRISSVCVDGERRLLLSWSGRRLLSACDERTGNTVSYGTDGIFLSEVRDAEGDSRTFSYTEDALLSRQVKSDGSFVSFDYALIGGKVRTVRTTDEEGKSETFSYDISGKKTVYTDHDGFSSSFCYDDFGRTVSESYADGSVVRFSYNDFGLLSSRTDEVGTVSFLYDEKKRPIQKNYPDGSCEKWEYTEFSLSAFTDRDGITKRYFYDSVGNVTDIFIGANKLYHIDYGENEHILEDCRGNKMRFSYDTFGNLIWKEVFARGSSLPSLSEKWEYDAKGRLVLYVDALGEKTRISYFPHKLRISRENGLEIEEEYSSRKQLLRRTETDKLTGEKRVLSYKYDKAKRCTALSVSGVDSQGKKIPEEKVFEAAYTDEGRLSRYIEYIPFVPNMPPAVREFAYDASDMHNLAESAFSEKTEIPGLVREYSPGGRLVRFKNGNSGFYQFKYDGESGFCKGFREESGTLSSFSDAEFYADGLVKSARDRLGAETFYEYDEFGNLVKIRSSERNVLFSYDKAGGIVSEIVADTFGKTVLKTEWKYEPRAATCIFGSKYTESYLLNAFGEVVAFVDGSGNKTVFVRDLLGRVCTVRDAYGAESFFTYNGRNQILSETFADKTFLLYEYDENGCCISSSDFDGKLWEKSYDGEGRVQTLSIRPFRATLGYSYDEYGNLSSIKLNDSAMTWERSSDGTLARLTDFFKQTQEFTSDGYGRILSHKNTKGDVSTVSYDRAGRISAQTDFLGTRHTYTYGNNSVSVQYADGEECTFLYDCAGNLVSAKNGAESLTFSYDEAGLLSSQSDGTAQGTVQYSYDGAKNLIQVRSAERVISYLRGKKGEILEMSDSLLLDTSRATSKISFSYDAMGREILRIYDSGERVKTVYDASGKRILTVGYSASNEPVFVDGAVYNESGELAYSLDSNFRITSYRYDDLGRLESIGYPYSEELAEKMKKELSDAGLHYLEGSASFGRHEIDSELYARLQSLSALVGYGSFQLNVGAVIREDFSYDANDNIIRKTNPFGSISYSHDSENRLVSWGKSGEASYDKNGNLLSKKSLFSHAAYEYNSRNRLKSARIANILSDETFFRMYEYDALGRRCSEYEGESGRRDSSFLGFGMSIFARRKVFSVGADEAASRSEKRTEKSEFSYSGRYAFIGDDDSSVRSGFSLSEVQSDYNLYPSYDYRGNLLASFSAGNSFGTERNVLMTDGKGSVMAECGNRGTEHFSYDVYGTPLSSTSHFSFGGKHFDSKTGMYDFGFRDYLPEQVRFTSSDPVHAGKNWYSYCGGNPVALFDSDGLYAKLVGEQYMQDMGHVLLGASKYKYKTETNGKKTDESDYADMEGCVVTAVAETLTLFTGLSIPNSYINSKPELFNGENISWKKVNAEFALSRTEKYSAPSDVLKLKTSYEVYQEKIAKLENSFFTSAQRKAAEEAAKVAITHVEDVKNTLSEIASVSAGYVVLAQVGYGASPSGTAYLHFVTVDTEIKTVNGQEAVEIRATSKYDKAENIPGSKYRDPIGWLVENGKTYVPLTLVNRIDVLSKNQ